MSFICQHTGEVVGPGIKQSKVVTERRERTYQRPIKKHGKIIDYEDVKGWEIVKEVCVGPDGYRALTGQEPTNLGSNAQSRNATLRPERESNSRPVEPWRFNRRNRRDNNNGGGFNKKRPGRPPVVEVVQTVKR